MEMDDKIKYALEHTELVRSPRQELATFGSSIVEYYVVTELVGNVSVVRDGKVIAERPKIVTPAYLVNVEGFSEQARRYVAMLARERPHESAGDDRKAQLADEAEGPQDGTCPRGAAR